MNEEKNIQNKEIKKITVGLILSWILGILAAISGITSLFSQPLTGILLLVLAVILLPPANKLMAEKLRFSISGGLKFIIVIVLLGIIGATMSSNRSSVPSSQSEQQQNTENQNQEQQATKEWYEVATFSGKGNQDTSSFSISGDKVKITAITCCGSAVGTYSSISLKSENGGYLLGAGLSISTDGAEEGQGETTYRNLKAGEYYISVITGVNWEVEVEEYR